MSADLFEKDEILAVCTERAVAVQDPLEEGFVPLVIGGDHSIAMGTVSGAAAHYRARRQDIGLFWSDAQGDMNLPGTSPSGNIHAMPWAHLLGLGDPDLAGIHGICPTIRPERVVLIGVRDIDAREREVLRESGIHGYSMRQIDEPGMARVCRESLEIINDGSAGFHISLEADGCDPAVIPGSRTLVPGGVNYREAHLLLEHCADSGRMLSMEVVELNPFLDQANVSAQRTVSLIPGAFGQRII